MLRDEDAKSRPEAYRKTPVSQSSCPERIRRGFPVGG